MLTKKISIHVPTTYHDAPAPKNVIDYYVKKTMETLSKLYGGATMTTANGAYFSPELNRLIVEKNYVIYSYCDSYNLSDIVAICEELKTVFLQESIMYEIADNARADFV